MSSTKFIFQHNPSTKIAALTSHCINYLLPLQPQQEAVSIVQSFLGGPILTTDWLNDRLAETFLKDLFPLHAVLNIDKYQEVPASDQYDFMRYVDYLEINPKKVPRR